MKIERGKQKGAKYAKQEKTIAMSGFNGREEAQNTQKVYKTIAALVK